MEFLKTNMTIWKAFPADEKTSRPGSRHLCALSGVNLDNTLDFIISFQTIDRCINHICSKIKDKDELLIGRLYLSLRDAVDPKRRISVGYINGLDSKYVSTIIKLVERCRNQVVMLPSYNLVITRLKKFIQMYSDFMTCSIWIKN